METPNDAMLHETQPGEEVAAQIEENMEKQPEAENGTVADESTADVIPDVSAQEPKEESPVADNSENATQVESNEEAQPNEATTNEEQIPTEQHSSPIDHAKPLLDDDEAVEASEEDNEDITALPPQNAPSTRAPRSNNPSARLSQHSQEPLTISIKSLASFKSLNPLKEQFRDADATLEHSQLTPRTSHTLNRLGFQPGDLLTLTREQKKDFIIERRAVDLMLGKKEVPMNSSLQKSTTITDASLMHQDTLMESAPHLIPSEHHPAQKSLKSFYDLKNKKIKQLLNWIQSEHERLQWIQHTLDSWESKSQGGTVPLAEENAATAALHNQKWQEYTVKHREELKKQQQEILERLAKHEQALDEANQRREHHLKEKSTFVKSKREFSEKVLQERQKQIKKHREQKRKEKEQNEYIRQLNAQNAMQDEKERREALLRRHTETFERNLEKHDRIMEEREVYALVKKHQYDTKLDELEHQKLLEQRRMDTIHMEKERRRQEKKEKAELLLTNMQENLLKKFDDDDEKREQMRLKREQMIEEDRQRLALAEEKRQRNIEKAERILEFKRNTYEQKVQEIAQKMEQWERLKADTLTDVHYNQELLDQKVEEITNVVQEMVSKGDWDLDRLRDLMNDLKTTKKATKRRTKIITETDPNPLTETAVPRYMQWVDQQKEKRKEQEAEMQRIRAKTPTYGVRRLSHHPAGMDYGAAVATPPPAARKSKTPTISRRPASAVSSLRKPREVGASQQLPSQQEKIPRANQNSVHVSRKRPTLVSSSATFRRGSMKATTENGDGEKTRKVMQPQTSISVSSSMNAASRSALRPKSASAAARRPSSASSTPSASRVVPRRATQTNGTSTPTSAPPKRPQSAGRTQRGAPVRASQSTEASTPTASKSMRGGRTQLKEPTTIVDSAVKSPLMQENGTLDDEPTSPSSHMKPRVVIRHKSRDETSHKNEVVNREE